MRFFASEFPNDNAALHRGTIWMSEEVCGPPRALFPPSIADQTESADGADDDGAEIEIVDTLEPLDALASWEPDADGARSPASLDPYAALVATLCDVARASGDGNVASKLEATLALDPAAMAWRAVLCGDSDNYAACGSASLDEWAADTLARLLGAKGRAAQIRRELRSRGVAAFGLIVAA